VGWSTLLTYDELIYSRVMYLLLFPSHSNI